MSSVRLKNISNLGKYTKQILYLKYTACIIVKFFIKVLLFAGT